MIPQIKQIENRKLDKNSVVEILKLVFPVGSTYTTPDDTNPSTTLGFGTWERLKGKVCLGVDEDDDDLKTIGVEGGEKTHTLTISEMPPHSHPISLNGTGEAKTSYGTSTDHTGMINTMGATAWGGTLQALSAGGGQAHNNMQPYKVVGYMWLRIA